MKQLNRPIYIKNYIAIFLTILFTYANPTKAATEIALISGAFCRTISIENIEKLAETGKTTGLLKTLLRFSNQDPKEVSTLLKQEYKLPLVLTSDLMNSTIGEVILERAAKIIYPLRVSNTKVSIPAIKAGIIKSIVIGKEKVNLVLFLKAYPNKTIAVNLPALFKIIDKVESITDLVKFFSDSPLDRLKDNEIKRI